MANSFTWIHIGTSGIELDPTEGNNSMENASALVGTSFGSAGSPLFEAIKVVTTQDLGGDPTILETDNAVSSDTFTTDLGGGSATYVFDAAVRYNGTITYADGTTASGTLIIAQDTTGHLFLAPEALGGGMTSALEAKPIRAISLDSVSDPNIRGFFADRALTGFDDGYIDGTSGDDVIEAGYLENPWYGTDRVDNSDAGLAGATGDDDYVRAGDGNDIVRAGAGQDQVFGGSGDDSLGGGTGNDTLTGEGGADTLSGEDGDDTLFGGDGQDTLSGGTGNDSLSGGAGNDRLGGGAGNDTLTTGSGNDTIFVDMGGGSDTISDFSVTDTDGDGFYDDQLDVSALDNGFGGPVTIWDVTVVDDGFGNARLIFPQGETLTLQGVPVSQMSTGPQLRAAGIPCFTSGTRVETPRGPVAIERLRPGDLVCTVDDGPQPLRWLGLRRLSAEEIAAEPHLAPVRIAAGALGNARALLVSPQHGVALRQGGAEHLVRAIHLARRPGLGLRQLRRPAPVTYVHLMFDRHQLIRTEGLVSESFFPGPQGLRALAPDQRAEIARLFPDCLPATRARPVLRGAVLRAGPLPAPFAP